MRTTILLPLADDELLEEELELEELLDDELELELEELLEEELELKELLLDDDVSQLLTTPPLPLCPSQVLRPIQLWLFS